MTQLVRNNNITQLSKRILVTGGAGFLGSHLCTRLLNDGHRVLCLDNGYSSTVSSIGELMSHPNFEYRQHDVIQPFSAPVDEIYNLACPASPIHYQNDPVKTVQTNVLGSINALELAKQHQATVFQASTSEIYGDPIVHPQTENYWGNVNPIGIRSCYDEGKRCAETLFFDYHRQHGINIKVARIFNTYGPKMQPNDGRVVSNFIIQALKNQPITIYGDGKQTRSFCYVDDLIEGMVRMMASDKALTGPINLGNANEVSIKALAEKIIELTGSRSTLTMKALPSDDPAQRQPDTHLAKTSLNWEAKTELTDGLKPTIAYFEQLLKTVGDRIAI